MLRNKKILLGVSGSIAAYKSALLVRLLVKAGAEVKVVMTPSSTDFITPLTLSTLSKNPVFTEFYNARSGEWANHVELGLWADALVIAPASANTLSKMASGACDNLLLAAYLSARCPVFFAPAMDLDMFAHPSTQENIELLQSRGDRYILPEEGELASGLFGPGRMAEPEDIMNQLGQFFANGERLKGRKALVTAGPTYEKLDPVRFIGNHASGKMGFALARQLADQGAEVMLISGPVSQQLAHPGVEITRVTSASEMFEACKEHYDHADIVVMSAAVADYTPVETSAEKIKKTGDELTLTLKKTPDILQWMGEHKKKQVLVGFALETNDEINYAKDKLQRKNLDLVVMNSLNDKGAGFGTDTNKITIIDRSLQITGYPLKSKNEVAADIVEQIVKLLA